jgi:hypothetical protein
MPLCLKFDTEFEVIVDLAVESNPAVTTGIGHRLMSGWRKIEDRKAAVRKPTTALGEPLHATIIRASVCLDVGHALKSRLIASVDYACYSTHRCFSSPYFLI